MSMALIPLAATMGTVICSWRGSMSTTMKPLVTPLYNKLPGPVLLGGQAGCPHCLLPWGLCSSPLHSPLSTAVTAALYSHPQLLPSSFLILRVLGRRKGAQQGSCDAGC